MGSRDGRLLSTRRRTSSDSNTTWTDHNRCDRAHRRTLARYLHSYRPSRYWLCNQRSIGVLCLIAANRGKPTILLVTRPTRGWRRLVLRAPSGRARSSASPATLGCAGVEILVLALVEDRPRCGHRRQVAPSKRYMMAIAPPRQLGKPGRLSPSPVYLALAAYSPSQSVFGHSLILQR